MFSYVDSSVKNISQLIDELLSFARSGNYDTEISQIHLHDVLTQVKQNLKQEISESSAIITQDNEFKPMLAHSNALIQLFQNLIANAIKFTASDVRPRINISAEETESNYIIHISDNGIGIDQKFLDIIFTPLKKLNSDQEFQGSGLGLATCKKIVEFYNGTIEAKSTFGLGSEFMIVFPREILAPVLDSTRKLAS